MSRERRERDLNGLGCLLSLVSAVLMIGVVLILLVGGW